VGILDNDRVDSWAKQAAINRRKSKFRVSYIDCYAFSSRLREKFFPLWKTFAPKVKFISYFYNFSFKPWFSRLSLPRDQIVFLYYIRSNHYNLTYSLHRKKYCALCSLFMSSCPEVLVRTSTMLFSTVLLPINPDI